MKIFGLTVTREKALSPVPSAGIWNGLMGAVREPFSGAWQRNISLESRENILAFSAVYACISLIANDISKLRLKLTQQREGIWEEITEGSTAFLPVLRKPNRYQTRIQFVSQWITCKLAHGNVYVLKQRDDRQVVTGLYVLDPRLVTPLVTDEGAVYYRLGKDPLSQVAADDTVIPASEIIHDRMLCLWHPLVGVSPIYACGAAATQGIRIQNNSAQFFENMSRPSGVLTAPAKITDETAERLKRHFEANYSGSNIGKIAVLGDGLEYEAMTIPASQAQLIEQLRFTVEDVARCFHVPLHMLQSGSSPTLASVGAINQAYYSQTLQCLIEDFELCLDEGLALPRGYDVEFDLDGLLRLDALSRADASQKAISAGYMTPNEARQKENLAPVSGGDTPYLQQQNWSLEQLDKRDIVADKAPVAAPPAEAPPATPEQDPPAEPPADPAKAIEALAALVESRMQLVEEQRAVEVSQLRAEAERFKAQAEEVIEAQRRAEAARDAELKAAADYAAFTRALVEGFETAELIELG